MLYVICYIDLYENKNQKTGLTGCPRKKRQRQNQKNGAPVKNKQKKESGENMMRVLSSFFFFRVF